MTSSNDDYDKQRLEIICNFRWTDDDIIKWREWFKGYNEYMNQEVHEGNCHCTRCMSEFFSK